MFNQQSSSAAGLSNGNFVVTWTSEGQDGDGSGVYGQVFDANSTKIGSEFQINMYTTGYQGLPSAAGLSNGNFVVTWNSVGQDGSDNGIYGQLYDGSGTKIGSEFQVNTYTASNQEGPSAVGLSNGNFVVTWESYDQDGSGNGVYGQIFNSNVTPGSTGTSGTSGTTVSSSSRLTGEPTLVLDDIGNDRKSCEISLFHSLANGKDPYQISV